MRAVLGALALAVPAFLPSADAIVVTPHDAGNPRNFHRQLLRREITDDVTKATARSWDFVIAGGGVAGLAVAARLSEWSNTTVLVVEAGTDGSEVADQINIPGFSYIDGLSMKGLPQDWSYVTTEQRNAGGKTKMWPRGKVLGGSGATNGMFWGRGSTHDYDAWADLNPGANQTWNWAEVEKYINKAENYSKPPQATIDEFHMVVDESVHGNSGPIRTGHSQWIYPACANWIPAWQELNLTAKDLSSGDVNGVMICPSIINVANQSRSDSKTGYIDPLPPRPNLMILTGQQVTKINFNGTDSNGNQVANGISFSSGAGATVYDITANKEVILSGGTVGSPQILQLSGIGPKEVLQPLNIPVLKDLPVGYNLQDHVSGTISFNTVPGTDTWGQFKENQTERAAALEQYRNSATGKWTYVNEAVGYVSIADISKQSSGVMTAVNAVDVDAISKSIASAYNLPSSVAQGLPKQLAIQKELLGTDAGQLEIILTMMGGGSDIGIQVALQKPFSRGTLFINSASAFDKPTIDPGYLNVDIDAAIVSGGLMFARKVGGTDAFKPTIAGETSAGLTEANLLENFRNYCGTEFHPCGTNSMLPEADGGVVDTNLLVYGTSNVRVIDASIMPMNIAAHLMATTYGIAEKGADIIKKAHVFIEPPKTSTSASMTSLQTSSSSTGTPSSSVDKDAASTGGSSVLTSGAKLGIGIGVGVGVAALLAAIIAFCCIKRRNGKRAGDEKGWYVGAAGGDAGADHGAWDTNAAYNEQGVPLGRPQRPFSSAGDSINTMATADLQPDNYQMGDYARGGNSPAPYQDYPEQGYSTTQFSSR